MYQEAIQDCNKLLRIYENNVGALYILGCAYEKLDDVDKGI